MRRVRIATAVFVSMLLTGCIVFPHRSHLTPRILGELAGRADVRVRVSASKEPQCRDAKRETSTNTQGRFVLAPLREWNSLVVVMAHRYFPWHLCVFEEGSWRVLHSARDYTLVDTGPAWTLYLRCAEDGAQPACREQHDFDPHDDAADEWLSRGASPAMPDSERDAGADSSLGQHPRGGRIGALEAPRYGTASG